MDTKRKAKILVVDDESSICRLLSRMLSMSGYEITTAENASEALDILSQSLFDLIVTDVNMPGDFSGVELLCIIKAGFEIPVIVISGYGTIEIVLECMRHGADEFIPKPLDASELINAVDRILGFSGKAGNNDKTDEIPVALQMELSTSTPFSAIMPLISMHAALFGLDEKRVSSMWLCIKEAMTGLFNEFGMPKDGQLMRVLLNNNSRELVVKVSNCGTKFTDNPHFREAPPADNLQLKGVRLMRLLCDGVSLNSTEDELFLTFLK